MSWKEEVLKKLESHLGSQALLKDVSPVGGGDINDAYRFDTSKGDFFVKKNSASRFPEMFVREAEGIQILGAAGVIPVPEVIDTGKVDDIAFLILHYINSAPKQEDFWTTFGKKLATLHQTGSTQFGLDQDNYIGSLYQSNKKHDRWVDFFREERLLVQVKLARDRGKMGVDTVKAFDRFYTKIEEIFPEEKPSLVHGDLWGGNFMVNEKGEAVLIDPAVYFGHREMDLGMSKLFGGFSGEFYDAYDEFFPLEKGWQQRLDYCNLYPLMVHVNLFGGGYLGSVKSILNKF